jgi:sorting nexin-1/2
MVTFEGMEQQRSSSGASLSPRSPSSSQPFLSVSVSDPVKLGNGVQAYISYRVITKVFLSLIHFVIFDFFFVVFF